MPPLYHAVYRKGVETTGGFREAVAILPWETAAEERVILTAIAYALKTTPDRLEVTNVGGWPFQVMNPFLQYAPQSVASLGWPTEGFKPGMSPLDNMVLGAVGRARAKADRLTPVIKHVTEGEVESMDSFNVGVSVSSRPDFRLGEHVAVVPLERSCQCGCDDCPVCVECRRVVAEVLKDASPVKGES